jgi:hypothetical protein
LAFLDDSSGRDNAVGRNNGSFLDYGPLQYHRILADIDFLLDCTRIERAVVSDHSVPFE